MSERDYYSSQSQGLVQFIKLIGYPLTILMAVGAIFGALNTIHLTYPNQLMKKELLRVRPKVLKHIRKALNNHAVDFAIEVKEENEKRFAYTPQEKYELLKEKNSAISLLRKTFNLEL